MSDYEDYYEFEDDDDDELYREVDDVEYASEGEVDRLASHTLPSPVWAPDSEEIVGSSALDELECYSDYDYYSDVSCEDYSLVQDEYKDAAKVQQKDDGEENNNKREQENVKNTNLTLKRHRSPDEQMDVEAEANNTSSQIQARSTKRRRRHKKQLSPSAENNIMPTSGVFWKAEFSDRPSSPEPPLYFPGKYERVSLLKNWRSLPPLSIIKPQSKPADDKKSKGEGKDDRDYGWEKDKFEDAYADEVNLEVEAQTTALMTTFFPNIMMDEGANLEEHSTLDNKKRQNKSLRNSIKDSSLTPLTEKDQNLEAQICVRVPNSDATARKKMRNKEDIPRGIPTSPSSFYSHINDGDDTGHNKHKRPHPSLEETDPNLNLEGFPMKKKQKQEAPKVEA